MLNIKQLFTYIFHGPVKRGILLVLSTLVLISCGGGGSSAPNTTTPPSTVDTTPPVITSSSPASGTTQIPLNSNIVVTFNESMQPISINSVTMEVLDPVWGTPIAGTINYDNTNFSVTFTPASSLAEYSTYKVVINGFTDASLNPLPYTEWLFTTVDLTPPNTTPSPAGGFYNTTQNITLTCDDAAGSGCAATYYTIDGSTPQSQPADLYTGPVALTTLNTPIQLKFYSVDQQGNAEAVKTENYVIDTIPPQVVSTVPANTGTNIVLSSTISATFSEPVLPATVSASSFTISAATHQITGSVSLDPSATVATFTADAPLECNTVYTATILASVTDRAGNTMQSDYSWTFTTHGDCDAPTTQITPNGGVISAASQSVTLNCTDSGAIISGCSRMVYTTDGSVPSLTPQNGTVINGSSTTFNLATGDTRLRFYSEDVAGNQEAVREADFSLSNTGFTYVATEQGLSRGIGPVPLTFVNTRAMQAVNQPYEAQFYDPSSQRIYELAGNSLYISDDNAATWVRDSAPINFSIDALYAHGNRVYIAGFTGILLSTDGAATFQSTNINSPVSAIYEMNNVVYAGSSTQLLRSTDRGRTYSSIYAADVMGIAGDGNYLYVATRSNGLLVSSDGGASFVNKTVTDGLGTNHLTDLFVAANGTLYVTTNVWPDGSPGNGGLSISTDHGNTYNTYTSGLATNNLRSVTAYNSNVFVSGYFSLSSPTNASIEISTDGGTTFTSSASMYEGLPSDAVADLKYINNRLYAFTEGGLAISDNLGVSFSVSGLASDQINDITSDNNGKLYIATGRGLLESTDGGYTFTTQGLESGLPSYIVDRFNVSSDGLTLNVTTDFLDNALPAGYAQSLNAAAFTQPASPPSASVWKGRGNIDVDGGNIYVAAGYKGYALLVSNDNGVTFTEYQSIGNVADSSPVDVAHDAAGNVFVSTLSGIGVSTDHGVTFPTFLTQAGNTLGSNRIGLLHIDGTTVYAQSIQDGTGTISGLSVSLDGGNNFTTWTTSNGLPSNNITSIDTYSGYLYIGTDSGLAITNDGGTSFQIRTTADGLGYNRPRAVLYQP